MNFQWTDLAPAYAEVFILGMACLILIVDLFLDDEQRVVSYLLSVLTLVGAAFITAANIHTEKVLAFGGTFVADPIGDLLKLFTYAVAALVFLYSKDYLRNRGLFKGEYYVLALLAVLGILVMISAHSLLTIYLGLELLSLSLYAMVAFERESPVAAEAAMKYFVLGAIASGTLLYGLSILYGVTGTLDIGQLTVLLTAGDRLDLPLSLSLAFVLVGIAFKFGAVPFHMWLPDVYHGAPTSVTLFIGSVAKVAAFALTLRLLVEGLGPLQESWRDMLIVLSVLSMAIGNIVAIAQTNIKRMLAYSTIAHVGFILLGFLSGTPTGLQAALYYTLAYVIMAAASFGMIILLSRKGFEADRLEDFKGLNGRSPWFALMMLILMFSLAGVPPLLGFYAKLVMFFAVLEADLLWLAVLMVVFSIIGAFYYLRVVKLMYFDEPEDTTPIEAGVDMRALLSANVLAILLLGIFPDALLQVCIRVVG